MIAALKALLEQPASSGGVIVTDQIGRTFVVSTRPTAATTSEISRSFEVATQAVEVTPPPPGEVGPGQEFENIILARAWQHVQHLLVDPESDRLLAGMMRGLFTSTQRLSLMAHGDGDEIGPWEVVTNPAKAPLWGLPAASQWTGGTMPARLVSESDDEYLERARLAVVHPHGMLRGGRQAFMDVAAPYLTASASVQIIERQDDDLWSIGFIARPGDITDVAALEAALNDADVVIAGAKVFVNATSTSPSWDQATRSWDDATGTWDSATIANVT